MAESYTKLHATYHLTLTDHEAEWLQAYLQNPLQDGTPEIAQHKRHREAIFTALHESKLIPSNPAASRPA